MMRAILVVLCFTLLFLDTRIASARSSERNVSCKGLSGQSENKIAVNACVDSKAYHIRYDRKQSRIQVEAGQKKFVLHRIPKNRDPAIVGTEKAIGFLPDSIQPYKKIKVLAYLISIRTNTGSGAGQCGSGAETFLNFLDVTQAQPKIVGSILIGSCKESIELIDQNLPRGEFGKIFVEDGGLKLDFLFYKKNEENLTAVISHDFKQLLFR